MVTGHHWLSIQYEFFTSKSYKSQTMFLNINESESSDDTETNPVNSLSVCMTDTMLSGM